MVNDFRYDAEDLQLAVSQKRILATLEKYVDSNLPAGDFHKLVGFKNLFSVPLVGGSHRDRLIFRKVGDVYVLQKINPHTYRTSTLEAIDRADINLENYTSYEFS